MSKTTKTPKGTTLPLMNLKGKDYLQVAYRLVWFREEEPQSGIETSFINLNDDFAIAHAKITRDGRVVATATKRETKKDFPDFVEKAETGAIGRALALLGYGTQFTLPDLDEGERLADSPVETTKATSFNSGTSSMPNSTVTTAENKPSGFTKPTKKAEPPSNTDPTTAVAKPSKGAWT